MNQMKITPWPVSAVYALMCAPAFCGTGTLWNFDPPEGPLKPAFGPASIEYRDLAGTGWGPRKTKFARVSQLALPPLPGGDAYVMGFSKTGPDEGYTVHHHTRSQWRF